MVSDDNESTRAHPGALTAWIQLAKRSGLDPEVVARVRQSWIEIRNDPSDAVGAALSSPKQPLVAFETRICMWFTHHHNGHEWVVECVYVYPPADDAAHFGETIYPAPGTEGKAE